MRKIYCSLLRYSVMDLVVGSTLLLLLAVVTFWYLYKYHGNKLTQPLLFANNVWFIVVNITLFGVAILANFKLDQLFCTPVTWATIVLCVFMLTFLSMPFNVKYLALKYVQAILLGAGIFILLYIIAFASDEYFIMMSFYIVVAIPFDIIIRYIKKMYNTRALDAVYILGTIIITPYFLLLQLARYYRSLDTRGLKRAFIISPLVVLLIGVLLSVRLNYLSNKFNSAQHSTQAIVAMLNNPVDAYLGELILGAHWKYHTELCMYDGIRPPLHDPVLGFAHMLHLHTGVCCYNDNYVLYRRVFPNNQINFNCSCSY